MFKSEPGPDMTPEPLFIDRRLQQAHALIHPNKLLTGELRNCAWIPGSMEISALKVRPRQDQGLNRSPIPSAVLACAHPHDIDPQTHSVKVF
jgi:hypothetical protein